MRRPPHARRAAVAGVAALALLPLAATAQAARPASPADRAPLRALTLRAIPPGYVPALAVVSSADPRVAVTGALGSCDAAPLYWRRRAGRWHRIPVDRPPTVRDADAMWRLSLRLTGRSGAFRAWAAAHPCPPN